MKRDKTSERLIALLRRKEVLRAQKDIKVQFGYLVFLEKRFMFLQHPGYSYLIQK
jgi:hypothetical protein